MKVLIFTEFVPTQAMLADYLQSRGFSVATLNGSMDLETRSRAQQVFSRDVRVLISTDAGGEGLNLQFCHVVVNFDMPWNPMRIEQRIGRVDRIGQHQVVRAVNFVLEDTVEHRVREVLEEKLEVIAREFGVDKASDVMDSVEVDPLFDELFIHGLNNPDSIEKECDAVVSYLRSTLAESSSRSELLSEPHDLDADDARKWRDHPAQFWLERAITSGLAVRGAQLGTSATRIGKAWRVKWADGSESAQACFDARTADENPELDWVTLEDPRARAVISELPRFVAGQPLAVIRVTGLPDSIRGIWSLWEISLAAKEVSRKRFLPVFVTEDGRSFVPTANRVWDLLLTEIVNVHAVSGAEDSARWFETSHLAARTQGERIFTELLDEHRSRLKEERQRASYAFEARSQAIGRIGLPAVRAHRRKRLQQEHEARLAVLDEIEICAPDLNAVMMVRIGADVVLEGQAA